MLGGDRNSCLLGKMVGILYCLYGKIFLPSIFNSVKFSSSTSCIVLDIELSDKKIGVFLMVIFRVSLLVLYKKCKPTNQAFWCTRTLHGIVCSRGCLDYSELPNNLPKDIKAAYFTKGTAKSWLLGNLKESLDDHSCPKVQDLAEKDEEMWIIWATDLGRRPHCTV